MTFNFLFFDNTVEFQIKDGIVTSSFQKNSNLFISQTFFNANLDLSSNSFASFVKGKLNFTGGSDIAIEDLGNNLFSTNILPNRFIDNKKDDIFSINESNNLNFSFQTLSHIDENDQIQIPDTTITFHNFTMLSVSNFSDGLTIDVTDQINTNTVNNPLDTDSYINQYKVDVLFNSNLNITGILNSNADSSIQGVTFNHLQVNSNNYNSNFFDIININGNGQGIIDRNKDQSIFTDNLSIFDNLVPGTKIDSKENTITNFNLQYASNSDIKTTFKSDIISDNINQTFLPNNNSYII